MGIVGAPASHIIGIKPACAFTRSIQVRILGKSSSGKYSAAFRRVGFMLEPKARSRDVWLVAILLEEQPLKDQRPSLAIFRQKFGAVGKIGENCVRLSEYKAVVIEDGCAAVGIDFQELGRPAFALQDIDFDDFARKSELRQQETDFIGVTGVSDVIEFHGP